jgi:hypothetical protein
MGGGVREHARGRTTTLLWILGLHIAVSVGVAFGLWGIGNNFIQRLNFARWIGVRGWPRIERLGSLEFSWSGVPSRDLSRPKVKNVREWIEDKERASSLPFEIQAFDFYMRYRPFGWPSLRFQRLWAVLPLLAACFSVVLFGQIREDGRARKQLCMHVANTLSFPDTAPIPQATFERARYLFDKAGCELWPIDPRKFS